jgi:transcriptional regulator with XRE-family HTH domain
MGGEGSGRRRDAARRAEAARLRRQGLTFAEIGRRLGVTRQCASALVRPPVSKRKTSAPAACYSCGRPLVALAGPPVPAESANDTLCLPCLSRQPETTFAQRLRSCRVAAGLSAARLCALAGLPPGYVTRHEARHSKPHARHLRQIAAALGPRLTPVLMGAGV